MFLAQLLIQVLVMRALFLLPSRIRALRRSFSVPTTVALMQSKVRERSQMALETRVEDGDAFVEDRKRVGTVKVEERRGVDLSRSQGDRMRAVCRPTPALVD